MEQSNNIIMREVNYYKLNLLTNNVQIIFQTEITKKQNKAHLA